MTERSRRLLAFVVLGLGLLATYQMGRAAGRPAALRGGDAQPSAIRDTRVTSHPTGPEGGHAAPLQPDATGPQGWMEGRITAKGDHKPIEGASVACWFHRDPAHSDDPEDWLHRMSISILPQGRFQVRGLKTGSYRLIVHAEGFAPSRSADLRLEEDVPLRDVVVEMTRGGALRGTVLSARTRQGLANADVASSADWFGEGIEFLGPQQGYRVSTDANGEFDLPHVVPGSHHFLVRCEGYVKAGRSVDIVEGETTDVEFALEEGLRVFGRILDPEGRPAAKGSVSARRDGPDGFYHANADADGNYALTTLTPGWYEISGSSDKVEETWKRRLTLRPGAALRLDFPGVEGAIHGVVRRNGRPWGDTWVEIASRRGDETWCTSTKTDAAGAYKVHGVRPGENTAEAHGLSARVMVPEGSGDSAQDIEFASATLAGHVFDGPARVPISGASVYLYRLGEREPVLVEDPKSRGGWIWTGVDGAFAFDGLSGGTYALRAQVGEDRAQVSGPISVPDGGTIDDLEFHMAPGGSIEGTVFDAAGRPLPGAAFALRERRTRCPVSGSIQGDGLSDALGHFRIDDLAEGDYVLTCYAPGQGHRIQPVRVCRGCPPVEIHLCAECVLRIRVLDEVGVPVQFAVLALQDSDGNAVDLEPREWTDQLGRLEQGRLAPGRYRGIVTSRSGEATFDAVVAKGEAAEAEVVFRHGR